MCYLINTHTHVHTPSLTYVHMTPNQPQNNTYTRTHKITHIHTHINKHTLTLYLVCLEVYAAQLWWTTAAPLWCPTTAVPPSKQLKLLLLLVTSFAFYRFVSPLFLHCSAPGIYYIRFPHACVRNSLAALMIFSLSLITSPGGDLICRPSKCKASPLPLY